MPHGLSSSEGEQGPPSSGSAGFSPQRLLLLRSTGSSVRGFSRASSQAPECKLNSCGAYRLSCSTPCGILPDQGWNLCLLHWQVDFLPLSHQGSPVFSARKVLLITKFLIPECPFMALGSLLWRSIPEQINYISLIDGVKYHKL